MAANGKAPPFAWSFFVVGSAGFYGCTSGRFVIMLICSVLYCIFVHLMCMDVSVLFRNFAPTKMTTEENKD